MVAASKSARAAASRRRRTPPRRGRRRQQPSHRVLSTPRGNRRPARRARAAAAPGPGRAAPGGRPAEGDRSTRCSGRALGDVPGDQRGDGLGLAGPGARLQHRGAVGSGRLRSIGSARGSGRRAHACRSCSCSSSGAHTAQASAANRSGSPSDRTGVASGGGPAGQHVAAAPAGPRPSRAPARRPRARRTCSSHSQRACCTAWPAAAPPCRATAYATAASDGERQRLAQPEVAQRDQVAAARSSASAGRHRAERGAQTRPAPSARGRPPATVGRPAGGQRQQLDPAPRAAAWPRAWSRTTRPARRRRDVTHGTDRAGARPAAGRRRRRCPPVLHQGAGRVQQPVHCRAPMVHTTSTPSCPGGTLPAAPAPPARGGLVQRRAPGSASIRSPTLHSARPSSSIGTASSGCSPPGRSADAPAAAAGTPSPGAGRTPQPGQLESTSSAGPAAAARRGTAAGAGASASARPGARPARPGRS